MRRQETGQEGPMQEGSGNTPSVRIESSISAIVGDFYIDKVVVYAFYQNKRVTEVPAGASFEIHAEYDIANPVAGLTFWSTCMTVYDVTHLSPIGSDLYRNHSGKGLLRAHDTVNVRMPSESTTFRVKLFANQGSVGVNPPLERYW